MNRLFKYLLALLILPATTQAGLFGDDDLLPADKAFALTTDESVTDTLQLNWAIAKGYYLYRSKMAFESKTAGVSLGDPVLPAGKIKHDEFFGEVETYRGNIQVSVPLIRDDSSVSNAIIQVSSQGCADRGICYPPQKKLIKVKLPALATPQQTGILPNFKKPGGLSFGFGTDDELLAADDAFRIAVDVTDANTLTARWNIADGYYLYRDKLKFSTESDKITLLNANIPAGEIKHDEAFGDVAVFHQQTEATIPLTRHDTSEGEVPVTFTFQGCEENRGVCYPPIKKTFNLFLPAAEASTLVSPAAAPSDKVDQANTVPLSEQDSIAHRLASGNTLATLLAFFGFGLLLAFTPCVFPMIPILSSIIVGQGETITARRGFILSVVYVLAMAVTYAIAGVIAGMFGENLQAAFQNPWVLSTFAAVFVLLSLSMFGFYQLQVPAMLQNKLSSISNHQQGGNLIGVAIMGFLSALIVGPCVAAPLAGALIYIGQTGDAILGGMALFALSLGMGAPLIAIGTGAGKLLPKAGGWMDAVKAAFGVMLLGVAIWMLERILPGPVTLLLWAILLITSAIYMGAIEPVQQEASGWKKLWKGIGLVGLLYGALLLIGAASGGSDPLRPLEKLGFSGSGATAQSNHMVFQKIKSKSDLERELAIAKSRGQPVMLDFYADWCVSCKELEKYTFSDARVVQATSHMKLLQADVTANDDLDKALMKHFRIIGPPSIIFYNSEGQERPDLRLVGFKNADDFIAHIGKL